MGGVSDSDFGSMTLWLSIFIKSREKNAVPNNKNIPPPEIYYIARKPIAFDTGPATASPSGAIIPIREP